MAQAITKDYISDVLEYLDPGPGPALWREGDLLLLVQTPVNHRAWEVLTGPDCMS